MIEKPLLNKDTIKIKRALLSVFDKTGIVELAQKLANEKSLYVGCAPDTFLGGGTTALACKNLNRNLSEFSKKKLRRFLLVVARSLVARYGL